MLLSWFDKEYNMDVHFFKSWLSMHKKWSFPFEVSPGPLDRWILQHRNPQNHLIFLLHLFSGDLAPYSKSVNEIMGANGLQDSFRCVLKLLLFLFLIFFFSSQSITMGKELLIKFSFNKNMGGSLQIVSIFTNCTS